MDVLQEDAAPFGYIRKCSLSATSAFVLVDCWGFLTHVSVTGWNSLGLQHSSSLILSFFVPPHLKK